MSSTTKIVWIDDNPSRESTATELGARFINVRGRDPAPEVEKLLNGPSQSLFVIDHVLDKASDRTHPVFRRGSTIAEAVKEKWPSCAVVGVTNAGNMGGVDLRTRGTYDALFSFQDFAKYIDRIPGIAHGFALVARTGPKDQRLVRLLRPPKGEAGRLLEALTDDLKTTALDVSIASRMYSWVGRLMDRPGFLLDELWSATLLGLNVGGFRKVAKRFTGAEYTGVFARPDERRWWSSGLSQLLYEQCDPEVGEFSWHAGRRLPGINKAHYSSCHYCGDAFPETVAFLDEASNDQRAMHLKCTALHPRHRRELYFEDLRIMLGGK